MQISISNRAGQATQLHGLVAQFCQENSLDAKTQLSLDLALEELVTNIISYGFLDDREHWIQVALDLKQGEVCLQTSDDGKPFNPLLEPPPDLEAPLEARSVGGLGIHMIRSSTDRQSYARQNDRNILTLYKRVTSRQGSSPK